MTEESISYKKSQIKKHHHDLWGIFTFWFIVLFFCNLATLVLRLDHQVAVGEWLVKDPERFLLGFFLQGPFLIVLAIAHYGVDIWLHGREHRLAKFGQATTTALFAFIILAIYASSEITYNHLQSYLGFDALTPLFTDTKQILLKSWHDAGNHMVAAALLSMVIGTLYLRWRHFTHPELAVRYTPLHNLGLPVFFILSIIIIWSLQFPAASTSLSYQSRFHSYPFSHGIMKLLDKENGISKVSLQATLPTLQPAIPMATYIAQAGKMKEKPNVFIIMLEAVSYDHLGATGYFRKDITPNLDALAKDSLIFDNAYATANHSNYAQTSIYSSQYALRGNSLDHFLNVDYPRVLIFDVLKGYDYQTALISSQNENWQGMKRFLTAHTKFDHFFHSVDELGENIDDETKLDDAFTRQKAQDYIAKMDPQTPHILAINFQRTHFPYRIPDDAPRPYSPYLIDFNFQFFGYPQEKVDIVRNVYDNALHYVDAQIGALMDTLKQQGLYDNSLIIVVPDHGEAFYEKGYPSHGTSLLDDQIRTFVLIKTPDNQHQGYRKDAISHVDIAPTILDILGLPHHPGFQGKSVLDTAYPGRNLYTVSQGVIPAYGVTQYPWKYIQSRRDGTLLLNTLDNPQENQNLLQQQPERANELKNILGYFYRSQLGYYQSPQRQTHYPPKL